MEPRRECQLGVGGAVGGQAKHCAPSTVDNALIRPFVYCHPIAETSFIHRPRVNVTRTDAGLINSSCAPAAKIRVEGWRAMKHPMHGRNATRLPSCNVLIKSCRLFKHIPHLRNGAGVKVANVLVEGTGVCKGASHGRNTAGVEAANFLVEVRRAKKREIHVGDRACLPAIDCLQQGHTGTRAQFRLHSDMRPHTQLGRVIRYAVHPSRAASRVGGLLQLAKPVHPKMNEHETKKTKTRKGQGKVYPPQ